MKEDIHNEDEYFEKAYKNYEEAPSPEVWQKISAGLDKTDADYDTKKISVIKRFVCLLLLLAGSISTYDLFFTGKDAASGKHSSVPVITRQSKTSAYPGQSAKDSSAAVVYSVKNNQTNTTQNLNHSEPVSKNPGKIHSSRYYPDYIHTQSFTDDKKLPDVAAQSAFVKSGATVNHLSIDSNTKPVTKESYYNIAPQSQALAKGKAIITAKDNDRAGNLPDSTQTEPENQIETAKTNRQTDVAENETGAKQNASHSAQNIKIKTHQSVKNYWTVLPYASVDFTQYHLDNDDIENRNEPDDKHDIEEREKHKFSFSAGVTAKWQSAKKVSVKTGLVYSNIAIGIQPQTLYATANGGQNVGYRYITSSGYAYVKPVFASMPAAGDSITSNVASHHLQYIYLPLALGYKIAEGKKISITPEAGVSANLLLSSKVRTEINEGSTDKEAIILTRLIGLRKIYFSFLADAEIHYSISKQAGIAFIPAFRYALNPITIHNVVKTYPYSFGLAAGITYRF